jgi:hypothetical protein
MVEAIGNGRVLDYRDAQYSNERFLIEMKGGSLARPFNGRMIQCVNHSGIGKVHVPAADLAAMRTRR